MSRLMDATPSDTTSPGAFTGTTYTSFLFHDSTVTVTLWSNTFSGRRVTTGATIDQERGGAVTTLARLAAIRGTESTREADLLARSHELLKHITIPT